MTGNNMSLTKEIIEANPHIIGSNLVSLAEALKNTKTNLAEVQNRNFWKRLANNNTKDLAELMLKQNDALSAFIVIVQGIIMLSMNNLVVLGGIMNSINAAEETNEYRDNEYFDLAKGYLTEALKSAERTSNLESEIKAMKIKMNIAGIIAIVGLTVAVISFNVV